MAYLIIYLCFEVSCVICHIIPAQNIGVSILSILEQRISRRVYQLPCLTWLSLSNIHRVSFSYNLARHCEHEFSLSRPRLIPVCMNSLCLNYTILKLDVSSKLFMVSSRLFNVHSRVTASNHLSLQSPWIQLANPCNGVQINYGPVPNQDSLFKFGRGTENVL